jgi:putative transposase
VIQRGNNRQAVFFAEVDYQRYLSDLGEIATDTDCRIHAFVLMTNHVHLLVTPTVADGISKLMQGLGRRYVGYFNRTHQRTGTLWEGRHKASLVAEDHYLLACMRYIELNPVRAGMVKHPGDYRWSSYQHNAYGRFCGLRITGHDVYQGQATDDRGRQHNYRELFTNGLDKALIHEIRQALNSCLVLGNDRFKDEIERQLKRTVRPGTAGRPRRKFQSDPD